MAPIKRGLLGTAALFASLLIVASASAKTVYQNEYNGTYPTGSFDGHDAVGPASPTFSGFSLQKIDIDQSNGTVYVARSGADGGIYKFDSAGGSQPFSALSPNTVVPQDIGEFGDIEVDNSPTATQGRFFAFGEGEPVIGHSASGAELPAPFPAGGLQGFSRNCGAAVAPDGNIWVAELAFGYYPYIRDFQPDGTEVDNTHLHPEETGESCDIEMDSQGNMYLFDPYSQGPVYKFDASSLPSCCYEFKRPDTVLDPGPTTAVAIDLSNDHVFVSSGSEIKHYSAAGELIDTFGEPEAGHSYPGLFFSRGLAVNSTTHVVYATNSRGPDPRRVDTFTAIPVQIPDATATTPSGVTAAGATINGTVNAAGGGDTTDCHFVWGKTTEYGYTAPCTVGGVPTNVFADGSGDHAVSAQLTGLKKGSTYHYALISKNANGINSQSNDMTFLAAEAPIVSDVNVTNINTDSAELHAEIDAAGMTTTYRFEWGTDESYGNQMPNPDGHLLTAIDIQSLGQKLEGLTADTTYHYRIVTSNASGTAASVDHTFRTFLPAPGEDPCPNAHVRQQTGASLLLDCRAYELVSAPDTGGYNVESDLVVGQTPFGGYPRAEGPSRVLYGIHSGAIPGPWVPTNHGVDPYVATRGKEGWSTEYMGIPADQEGSSGTFASPLAGADQRLDSFAFGGQDICEPCFPDGSTNVPLRMPDGTLIKGMAGSLNPAADPSGHIAKRFSGDGSHFVFGSTAKFEPDANSNGTDTTIYERDLDTDTTQVISKLPNGSPIANGAGVGELDISDDGSRAVVGQLVSTDPKGNRYYHLYMHIGGSPNTIDLTPGASHGALYDGMSADGTEVYFTTVDPLMTTSNQDGDTSGDIFRADVGPSSTTLTRISTGAGAGNTDACDPASDSVNAHWNTIASAADCSATAIAGGGGVASGSGEIYFLSPESLDTSDPQNLPVQDAPNLYLSKPGQPARFVAALDSSLNGPPVPLKRYVFGGSFGSFSNATGTAVAPNGDIYVFDIGDEPPQIERYSPSGNLVSTNDNGGNFQVELSEEPSGDGLPTQISVDSSTGELYVSAGSISRFDDSGSLIESGFFGSAVTIAVNSETHDVYLGSNYDASEGLGVINFKGPTQGGGIAYPVVEGGTSGALFYPRALGTDSFGRVYVGGRRGTFVYSQDGTFIRRVDPRTTFGIAVDPTDDSVYLTDGSEIRHYTSTGAPAGPVEGGGLTAGRGLALSPDGSRLYAVQSGQGGEVRYFDRVPAPNPLTDNPAVVHAVNDAGTRHTEDFQVTPDGSFAAFTSAKALTGFESRGHSEVFRYDAGSSRLDCASCSGTEAGPRSDATLASNGLSLADDGRVFFNSAEPLVLRDTNGMKDAYEWAKGEVQLVSPGSSPFDSSLLGVSADGTDAYFFTRDTLVPQDSNGTLVKIYDARADDGYPFIPQPPPCRASDECHGAGSQAPPPPRINTISGTRGNSGSSKRCRRGSVRKHGKCVKKRRKKHHKPRKKHHTRHATRKAG